MNDTTQPSRSRYALTLVCRSARGQVAAALAFLERHGAYVEQMAAHDDVHTSRFFVRVVFNDAGSGPIDVPRLRQQLAPIAKSIDAIEWGLHDLVKPRKVLIMVSRLGHCLQDLLGGFSRGELPMQPVAIVSNHQDMWALARSYEILFHHLPVDADSKASQERQLRALVDSTGAELIVLARYMQVLSSEFCNDYAGRVINIHHSFLPGFKGAKPYHQAFERGVKLIGATAHFATSDLDEGPIIEQATDRVDHAHSAEDLLNVGRRMECAVLSRALKDVLEHRVFVNGQRTVVLR